MQVTACAERAQVALRGTKKTPAYQKSGHRDWAGLKGGGVTLGWIKMNKTNEHKRVLNRPSLRRKPEGLQFTLSGWFHPFEYVFPFLYSSKQTRLYALTHTNREMARLHIKRKHAVFHLWCTVKHLSHFFSPLHRFTRTIWMTSTGKHTRCDYISMTHFLKHAGLLPQE